MKFPITYFLLALLTATTRAEKPNIVLFLCDDLGYAATAGEVIYSESFDKNPGYVRAKGANDNNISSVAFGAGDAGFPTVQVGQYAGTSTGERAPIEHIDMNLHLRLAGADGKVEWRRPNSHPELCANTWKAPWDPRDEFHVYGCDVSKKSINLVQLDPKFEGDLGGIRVRI